MSTITHETVEQWRARMDAKRQQNAYFRDLNEAAVQSQKRRPPRKPNAPKRPEATAQPCPDCGRMTRPPRTTIEDWPDTIKRHHSGKCYRCESEHNRERPCKRDGCDNIIPAGSYGHREYCTDQCRRRASNPPPKTTIVCKRCGTVFTRKLSERREYCTNTCYHRARNEQKAARMRQSHTPAEQHAHTCDHCGKPYTPTPRATQRFCQPKCRWADQRARKRAAGQDASS